MNGATMAFLRPGVTWLRLPVAERRRTASVLLDCLRRIRKAWQAERPSPGASVRALSAWCAIGEDLEYGETVWRAALDEAQRDARKVGLTQASTSSPDGEAEGKPAPGAGRSPAMKGHGRPASASPAGAGIPPSGGVETPCTPTAVPSSGGARE